MTEQRSGRFAIIPAQAVEDRRLGPAALRVLAALSTYSDKGGWCWPAVRTIADRVNISRQAVQQHIRRLTETGYVERCHRRRPDGGSATNLYRIPVM